MDYGLVPILYDRNEAWLISDCFFRLKQAMIQEKTMWSETTRLEKVLKRHPTISQATYPLLGPETRPIRMRAI